MSPLSHWRTRLCVVCWRYSGRHLLCRRHRPKSSTNPNNNTESEST